MSEKKPSGMSRRGFIRRAPAAVLSTSAASALAAEAAAAEEAAAKDKNADKPMPKRVLGRTKLEVTAMTMGTAPCGMSPGVSVAQITEMTKTALDLGVNYIDTAPGYGNAEEGIGPAIGKRRKDTILGTKLYTDSVTEAKKLLANSLKMLKTDYVDILYFHQLGDRNLDKARQDDGVYNFILEQKKKGVCRFAGVTSHNRPGRVGPFLDVGDVDVVMMPVNFADIYTYGYETEVMPVAKKHNVGVVAMKVFGGPFLGKYDDWCGRWNDENNTANVGVDNLEIAIRYALSVPGVATANLGVHKLYQVKEDVKLTKGFTPITDEERAKLAKLGKKWSAKWGEQYGPVAEKKV